MKKNTPNYSEKGTVSEKVNSPNVLSFFCFELVFELQHLPNMKIKKATVTNFSKLERIAYSTGNISKDFVVRNAEFKYSIQAFVSKHNNSM